jgi:dihydroneopterin aldolase
MSNKIFVKDLEIEAIIGIFDWEREVKQLIKISYEVEVDITKAFKSDNIDDTFDYKTTSKKIIKFVEKSSFQLIEALAEKVSKIIMQDERVLNLSLSVSKPGALRGSKEVGLTIFRSR